MKLSNLLIIAVTVLAVACGSQPTATEADSDIVTSQQLHKGDSTIYGLACDGCTDTILVFLRNIDADPDTLNILEATRRHRIFGRPGIGDKVAVVRNSADSTIADIVINMETLRGSWFYQVMPTPRPRPDLGDLSTAELLRQMPDSLRDSLMVPREYGMLIRGEGGVSHAGKYYTHDNDDDSPVEYPKRKNYRQWFLYNGKLVLTETERDSLGQEQPVSSDTATFLELTADTLVLRFNTGVQGYYSKEEE